MKNLFTLCVETFVSHLVSAFSEGTFLQVALTPKTKNHMEQLALGNTFHTRLGGKMLTLMQGS